MKDKEETAASFAYTLEEFEKWVKLGGIPSKLAKIEKKRMKASFRLHIEAKKMVERLKGHDKKPTVEDWIEFSNNHKIKPIDLKSGIDFCQFLLKNREELLQLLKEPDPKPVKIRHSGHYVDQKLRCPHPKKKSLYEILSDETRKKIASKNVHIRTEGIRLSQPQDNLMNALMQLLHEKSENRDAKSSNFYSGNEVSQLVPYGGNNQKSWSPVIRASFGELCKAYLGRPNYSGEEKKFIKSLLHQTEQQRFLIIYERRYEILPKGKKSKQIRTDRIEDFQSLFKIVSFFENLSEDERHAVETGNEDLRDRRGELIIALNPLLTDQIREKYVEYPVDINRRMVIAAGGHRMVTESFIALRDYFLRELSAGRKTPEINEENLALVLKLENYVKAKRKKLILERIDSAIQATKNLGLLTKHERILGALGQWKYRFILNPEFE